MKLANFFHKLLILQIIISPLSFIKSITLRPPPPPPPPTKISKAPFNAVTTVNLAKDMAYQIVSREGYSDSTFAMTIGACFGIMKSKADSFTSELALFWKAMAKVYGSMQSKVHGSNTFLIDSFNTEDYLVNVSFPLQHTYIQDEKGRTVNCGSFLTRLLPLKSIDKQKILSLLDRGDYFGGYSFNDVVPKPFITGVVGTRRHMLQDGAFGFLNGKNE